MHRYYLARIREGYRGDGGGGDVSRRRRYRYRFGTAYQVCTQAPPEKGLFMRAQRATARAQGEMLYATQALTGRAASP